ncbi:MAG: signal peptide peptidase SppA [Thermoguttaceae bacterium]|nr:signal peptide peptidase SppA [Thermoguttaceae bacterium]
MSNDQFYSTTDSRAASGAGSGNQYANGQNMEAPYRCNGRYVPPMGPPFAWMPVQKQEGCFWSLCKCLIVTAFGICFACFMMIVGIGGCCGAFLSADLSIDGIGNTDFSVTEKVLSGSSQNKQKIVILPVEGLITEDENGFIRKSIRQIRKDNNVCAVVLRVDSPGGTESGSDYYYHLLKELKESRKIPIVVSMGGTAASGGYYVSMAGDKIYAERSTWTGSIGVIVPLYNAAELCDKLGIHSTPITSGAMKGMGSMAQPMSEEEKVVWQELVDDGFQQFLSVIREGRPYYNPENENGGHNDELLKLADGRVYTAEQAKELHLIDEIGFLDDAVEAAMELVGCDEDQVQVVRYQEYSGLWESLLGVSFGTARKSQTSMEKIVARMGTPCPYYIMPQSLPVQ